MVFFWIYTNCYCMSVNDSFKETDAKIYMSIKL